MKKVVYDLDTLGGELSERKEQLRKANKANRDLKTWWDNAS